MKIMMHKWCKIGLVSAVLFIHLVYAAPLTPEEQQAKQQVETIYTQLHQDKRMPIRLDKLVNFS
jgi:hypothetical protein